jgi:Pyridoxamine 5'-phosphate oxidase
MSVVSRRAKPSSGVPVFTKSERAYLVEVHPLARLATVGADGTPHVMPLGMYRIEQVTDAIVTSGHDLTDTKKWRDVQRDPRQGRGRCRRRAGHHRLSGADRGLGTGRCRPRSKRAGHPARRLRSGPPRSSASGATRRSSLADVEREGLVIVNAARLARVEPARRPPVQPPEPAEARVFDIGRGPKTDAHDAHAVAMVALRDRGPRELTVDADMKVLMCVYSCPYASGGSAQCRRYPSAPMALIASPRSPAFVRQQQVSSPTTPGLPTTGAASPAAATKHSTKRRPSSPRSRRRRAA